MEQALNDLELKMQRPTETRWQSHQSAVNTLRDLMHWCLSKGLNSIFQEVNEIYSKLEILFLNIFGSTLRAYLISSVCLLNF